MKHNVTTLLGAGAIVTGALFGAMPGAVPAVPALAACNEGTPNCLPIDGDHQRANQYLAGLNPSDCVGNPDGICDDSLPGSDLKPLARKTTTKPATIHAGILAK